MSVVSTVKSAPPMASDELRRQADSFIDLADLENIVGRAGGPARKPRADDEDYEDDFEDDYEDVD